MKDIELRVEEIVAQLGLHQQELAQRKAYLEIGEADVALLRGIHAHLEQAKSEFTESFYSHLLSYPELQSMLSGPATLARLKHAQSEYFSSLTAGEYGLDYVEERLRIGIAHQRIGLDPKWYIGAYRKFLSDLMPIIHRLIGGDVQRVIPIYDALLKIVCFDMGLALDTYFEADRQAILRLKNYAEHMITHLPVGLAVVDAALEVRSLNPAMRKLLGVRGEASAVGKPLSSLIASRKVLKKAKETLRTGASVRNLREAIARGATELHLEFKISRTSIGSRDFLMITAQDITERVQSRAKLHESEERFRLTFSLAAVGLAHVGVDGKMLRVNRRMQDIVGYAEHELLNLTYQQLSFPEDLPVDEEWVRRLLAGEIQSYGREKRYVHKDGHPVWVQLKVSVVRDEQGRPRYMIAAVEDISDRKKAADQLIRLANYDALTNLPNRVLLQDRLRQAIAHGRRFGQGFALLFIDLDRFKDINDSLGHEAGDNMLVETGRRLARQVRGSDTVARLGGDEFVVLLQDIGREEEAATVARKILAALCEPITVRGVEFFPSGSIGISLYPKDGDSSETLLKNADTAMYQAKAKGKNNFQFYAQEMNERILRRLSLESGLRHALEKNELALHYQPQIDTRTGQMVGVEGLLRWLPPGRAPVAPADFIPLAEETGLILPIGQWVLREACAQSRRWTDAGLPPIRMTVNLSARQFRQDIAGVVAAALDETGCDPACLTLELTESVLMESPELTAHTLRKLTAMGVQLAIDDFGTGYSSLNYLSRFPISTLKIDRSFVIDVPMNRDDAAIVKAVIALAQAMGMDVIAEGVETGEQMEFLKAERCDLMQGYYFARPMPAAEVEALLSGQPAIAAAGIETRNKASMLRSHPC